MAIIKFTANKNLSTLSRVLNLKKDKIIKIGSNMNINKNKNDIAVVTKLMKKTLNVGIAETRNSSLSLLNNASGPYKNKTDINPKRFNKNATNKITLKILRSLL